MSASENFLKYFLEKRKNMKHFKIKIQLFSECFRDIKLSIFQKLNF